MLDRVWELVFPADGYPDRDAFALLQTLSLALPFGTKEKDQPVSRIGHQQTLEEHQRWFAAYVLDYHKLRQSVSGAGDDEAGGYVPARSLYYSLPEAQAELRRPAEGATGEGFLECMT